MGEYWKPVNVTRREYIHPHDLNCGLKLNEWHYPKSRVMRMIAERWSDTDTIVAIGDYSGQLTLTRVQMDDEIPSYDDLSGAGWKRISLADEEG